MQSIQWAYAISWIKMSYCKYNKGNKQSYKLNSAMKKVEERINHNYYKQIADKITQLLDKIHDSQLSEKRWVWELMQNAKDVPNKFGRVSVLIELWEDKLVFSHNGDYFTDGNITGLIQQVSSKDSANEGEQKQTGKFGTGFITTHLLSNIIDVKGIVKNPNTEEFQNFVLTLDRSARKSEDMIESITKNLEWVKGLDTGNYHDFPIAEGYERRLESDYLTSFTYHLNEDSLKSASVGLSDLINTLPITMVSLHELKSVRVINHVSGTEQLYECNSETIHNNDNAEIIRSAIDINGNKKFYLTYKTFGFGSFDDAKRYVFFTPSAISHSLKEITASTAFSIIWRFFCGFGSLLFRRIPLRVSVGSKSNPLSI